jgi:phosphate uptake regulator
MGNLASEMWGRTADSWYQRDHSAAAVLAERDNEMDELHASLIAELSSGRMALAVTIEVTLMAPLYERLSDHAVNIGRPGYLHRGIGPAQASRAAHVRRGTDRCPATKLRTQTASRPLLGRGCMPAGFTR